jgi:hypothetical protein
MQKRTSKGKKVLVLGPKAFSAITAVEGLALSTESRTRLSTIWASNLTPEQGRAEVLRAYAGSSRKR